MHTFTLLIIASFGLAAFASPIEPSYETKVANSSGYATEEEHMADISAAIKAFNEESKSKNKEAPKPNYGNKAPLSDLDLAVAALNEENKTIKKKTVSDGKNGSGKYDYVDSNYDDVDDRILNIGLAVKALNEENKDIKKTVIKGNNKKVPTYKPDYKD